MERKQNREGIQTNPRQTLRLIEVHLDTQPKQLPGLVESRAQNLFITRQLHCAEAVFLALNQGFGGELSEETAIRLASTMTDGFGGAGCLCGALGGSLLALGLFLSRDQPSGRDKYNAQRAAKVLHDLFRDQFGSTCCRVLNNKTKKGSRAHFEHCKEMTGVGARLAAQIILERRPELARKADLAYLEHVDSKLGSNLKRVANLIQS